MNPSTSEPGGHAPRTATAPIAVSAATVVGAIDNDGTKNRHDTIVTNTKVSRVPAQDPGLVAITPPTTLHATITHQSTGQTRPNRDKTIKRPPNPASAKAEAAQPVMASPVRCPPQRSIRSTATAAPNVASDGSARVPRDSHSHGGSEIESGPIMTSPNTTSSVNTTLARYISSNAPTDSLPIVAHRHMPPNFTRYSPVLPCVGDQ